MRTVVLMSAGTIIITLMLGLAALRFTAALRRFLIPVWLCLAAYAVSGRYLWLAIAVVLAVVVVFKTRMEFKRRRDALLELAPPDADEGQQEAFRQRIPEYEKIKTLWRFTRVFHPTPWQEDRVTIANYLCLPPPPESQKAFRDGLSAQEMLLLVMAEGGSKKRLGQALAEALIKHARGSGKDAGKRGGQHGEADLENDPHDPIHLDPPPVVTEGTDVIFELETDTSFSCDDEMSPIPLGADEYPGHLSFRHDPPTADSDWPESALTCVVQLQCAPGNFVCETRVYGVCDLEAIGRNRTGLPWSDVPDMWRESFETRCLASGVRNCDDSRSRFDLVLGEANHVIMTKYLDYHMDLAVAEDGRNVLIRIHGLLAERWVDSPDQSGEQKLAGRYPVPPFCVMIPAATFLPFVCPSIHGAPEDEDREEDLPILFRRISGD